MNWKELKAIHLSLLHFSKFLRGKVVKILSDNTSALACIRRQGSLSSVPLSSLTEEILLFCERLGISLVACLIKGVLNVSADKGSRDKPVSTEWSIDLTTFAWICELVPSLQVDLFTTRDNARLRVFVSPCPDRLAVGVDAFSLDWNVWDSIYLFPPLQVLPEVVVRLGSFRGSGVLIAPRWTAALWFPGLARRCRSCLPLPRGHALSQLTSRGLVFLPNLHVLNLYVWML